MALVETHKILSIIREHGVDEKTANAIVDAISYSREDLVTKKDLEILKNELTIKIWQISMTNTAITIAAITFIQALMV